jgi:hypothetical protein
LSLQPKVLSGSRAFEWASTNMPGVYEPVILLKAHTLKLFGTIISVLATSFEGEKRCFSSSCRLFSNNLLVAEFTAAFRGRMSDSETCSDVKLLILELEEVRDCSFTLIWQCFAHMTHSVHIFAIAALAILFKRLFFAPKRFAVYRNLGSGPLPSNEAAKRERETRRGSLCNELASPVSTIKGVKRTPSVGVWSLASHRENWRSNLSFGALLFLFFKKTVAEYVCSQHLRMRRLLLVYIGIQGIWNVMLNQNQLQNAVCVHPNDNNTLLAAANHHISRSTIFWQHNNFSYSCVTRQFWASANTLIASPALQDVNKHAK